MHCTAPFIFFNVSKIIWHLLIIFKTIVDEILGGYIITRGVVVDFLTILSVPVFLPISMLMDFSASDLRRELMIKLRVLSQSERGSTVRCWLYTRSYYM